MGNVLCGRECAHFFSLSGTFLRFCMIWPISHGSLALGFSLFIVDDYQVVIKGVHYCGNYCSFSALLNFSGNLCAVINVFT